MKKTAIYVRQSVEKDNSISCQTQIEFCKKQLKTNHEYAIYSDNGYSVNDEERPAFNEMMSAIENGEIDTIIIYKLDRIFRDIGSFCNFAMKLHHHNIKFISASEDFDSSYPNCEVFLKYLMIFAEMERANHSERCHRGWALRKQKKEVS